MMWMIYVLIALVAIALILMVWAACVVAGSADDKAGHPRG